MKEVNVYYSFESWKREMPDAVLSGEIIYRDGSVCIRTSENMRSYVQMLSGKFIFAITEKMPYGFAFDERNCFVYLSIKAWENEEPDMEFTGVISREETNSEYFSIVAEGFKQHISKDKAFAVVYQE